MHEAAIVLARVTKRYPAGVRALDGVSLAVGTGEWVALTGPSGSGKTTLLNLLDGLDSPTSGRVTVLGTELGGLTRDETATFRRENVGLVFQQFHLVPYLSALENVMLAQYYHSMVDRRQALAALEAVELAGRATHLPSQLSGGEQQRVCIARALINEPRILLADEPTGNLDEANEAKVLEIFRSLHARGMTLVVATHDRTLGELAGRRIRLRHGRVIDDGLAARRAVPRAGAGGAPVA
jgi:putative ABC transport system ATP-binding protein